MKQRLVLLLLLGILVEFSSCPAQNTPNPSKKKVIVLTSKGGNGHMAACEVLKDSLPEYEIKVVNPFEEIIRTFGPIKRMTRGKYDAEQLFYNKLLQNGWIRTINFLSQYPAPLLFHVNRTNYTKRFTAFLEKEKPDLLISVIPFLNYPASIAAKKCKIPFLLITLDADLTNWLFDLKMHRTPDLSITIGTQTPHIAALLAHKKISTNNIHVVGHPIRKNFFTPKNLTQIKTDFSIPPNKAIIMLMRGGTGTNQLIHYVKTLSKLDIPLHLLVCIGRNTHLIPKLKALKIAEPVSLSIVPFTPRVADLMAVSDLLITQPSPNVCNEAIHSGLPIILDLSGPCLFWERATIDWIKINGSGTAVKKLHRLNTVVSEYLNMGRQKITTAHLRRFDSSIKSVVDEMFNSQQRIV